MSKGSGSPRNSGGRKESTQTIQKRAEKLQAEIDSYLDDIVEATMSGRKGYYDKLMELKEKQNNVYRELADSINPDNATSKTERMSYISEIISANASRDSNNYHIDNYLKQYMITEANMNHQKEAIRRGTITKEYADEVTRDLLERNIRSINKGNPFGMKRK